MTVIPYAGVFINNAVRALFIFLDTVTASLLCLYHQFSSEKTKRTLSGSFQSRVRLLSSPCLTNY